MSTGRPDTTDAREPDDAPRAGPDAGLDSVAAEWGVEPVLAALAETAQRPPGAVRDVVLRHAGATPRLTGASMPPATVYVTRVEALREVLDSLAASEWQAIARPYAWTVHGLVAHLLAIEEYTAAQLGLGTPPDGDLSSHLDVGAAMIERELSGDPTETVARWSERAGHIAAHVAAPSFDLEQPLHLHGWPFRASTALIARAFELWTHTDDIRRAAGRPTVAPGETELRTMSTVSVHSLPAAVGVVAPTTTLGPIRMVLTGPGGGTFDLAGSAGTSSSERTLLAADVVDYCRVVARRIEPEDLDCEIDGDPAVAAALLEAARILAV